MKCPLSVMCVVYLWTCCCCESDFLRRQKQELKSQLLENYTSVAPSDVEVNVTFNLISILALEEASQVFRFSACLVQNWKDSWLTWDNNRRIYSIDFGTSEIWTPDLFIPNGVGEKISSFPDSMPAMAFVDGTVMTFMFGEFETICNIDVTWYPYDEQVCHMSIMTLANVKLSVGNNVIGSLFTAYFTGSSEWELLSTSQNVKYLAKVPKEIGYVDIEFRLRRHSIFYTLSIIFPMCLLSFLNSFVFLLPAASGEKISFLLSIFVSGAVFLNFINDAIPKSSAASRLTIYLVLLMSQSTLALLATLFVMNVHHRQGSLLCHFRNNRKVKDKKTSQSQSKAEDSELGHPTDKLDKVLFLIFFTMAALSILVFYI